MSDTTTNVIVPDPTYAALLAALPAAGSTYADDAFGETILRITDVASEAPALGGIVVEYASTPGTNCDSTLLRLFGNGAGSGDQQRFYVRQGDGTWSLGKIKTGMQQLGPSDFWWHPTDNDLAYTAAWPYYLKDYKYSTNSQSTIHDFSSNGYSLIKSLGECGLSNDGDKIALQADSDLIIYEFSTDSIIASAAVVGQTFASRTITTIKDVRISGNGNNIGISADGSGFTNYFFVFEDDGAGGLDFVVSPDTTNGEVHFNGYGIGHKDFGTGPDGIDYCIGVESQNTNIIYRVNLADASFQRLRAGAPSFPGWGNNGGPSSGSYVSCNGMEVDGEVFISFYSTSPLAVPGVNWGYYQAEYFSCQYDQSGDVTRWCHNRANPTDSGGNEYYKFPKMFRSTDRTQLIFSSDMTDGSDNYADTWALLLNTSDLGSVALSGTGDLAAAATKTGLGASSLGGTGSLAVAGYRTAIGAPGPAGTSQPTGSMGMTGATS